MLHAPVSKLTQKFASAECSVRAWDDDTQVAIFYFLIRSISSHSDHYSFQVGQMMSCRKRENRKNLFLLSPSMSH